MAFWGDYVTVAERQAKAKRQVTALRKKGMQVDPVEVSGTMIARTFWGKSWCRHLESFSDYSNRLPRGRSYVRHGAVCHLVMQSGLVSGLVNGSSLYRVEIKISELPPTTWVALTQKCTGKISSMLELLGGKLSESVMEVVCDRNDGLFPKPREIKLSCSCPDGARMCKHVAAVLYGVGNRLDNDPELLFVLRGVDPAELLASPVSVISNEEDGLADNDLASLFGIEMDFGEAEPAASKATSRKKTAKKKRAATAKARPATAKSTTKAKGSTKAKGASATKARSGTAAKVKVKAATTSIKPVPAPKARKSKLAKKAKAKQTRGR